ncbi:hypothetical protein CFP56_023513 [Quercus suber]|uniref:Uncharacterized protein n=1 Tax=Quercus suber TaxID=58331 RepID=A0AAW0K8Q6_QUESU
MGLGTVGSGSSKL